MWIRPITNPLTDPCCMETIHQTRYVAERGENLSTCRVAETGIGSLWASSLGGWVLGHVQVSCTLEKNARQQMQAMATCANAGGPFIFGQSCYIRHGGDGFGR